MLGLFWTGDIFNIGYILLLELAVLNKGICNWQLLYGYEKKTQPLNNSEPGLSAKLQIDH